MILHQLFNYFVYRISFTTTQSLNCITSQLHNTALHLTMATTGQHASSNNDKPITFDVILAMIPLRNQEGRVAFNAAAAEIVGRATKSHAFDSANAQIQRRLELADRLQFYTSLDEPDIYGMLFTIVLECSMCKKAVEYLQEAVRVMATSGQSFAEYAAVLPFLGNIGGAQDGKLLDTADNVKNEKMNKENGKESPRRSIIDDVHSPASEDSSPAKELDSEQCKELHDRFSAKESEMFRKLDERKDQRLTELAKELHEEFKEKREAGIRSIAEELVRCEVDEKRKLLEEFREALKQEKRKRQEGTLTHEEAVPHRVQKEDAAAQGNPGPKDQHLGSGEAPKDDGERETANLVDGDRILSFRGR